MPTGTALEQTSAVLHEIGSYLATVPEVTDYQGYAGTAAPINFNGLVRQYYLRAASEQGDIQVNLQDKHKRDRSSHEVAGSVREPIEKIAKQWGAKVKIVEVPPGPPVMSPIVAEIYGPDYEGARRVAGKVREQFGKTADIVGIDDTVTRPHPKWCCMCCKARLHCSDRTAGYCGYDTCGIVRAGCDFAARCHLQICAAVAHEPADREPQPHR